MRPDPRSSACGQPGAPGDIGGRNGGEQARGLPRGKTPAHGQGGARDAECEAKEKEEAEQEENEDGGDAEQVFCCQLITCFLSDVKIHSIITINLGLPPAPRNLRLIRPHPKRKSIGSRTRRRDGCRLSSQRQIRSVGRETSRTGFSTSSNHRGRRGSRGSSHLPRGPRGPTRLPLRKYRPRAHRAGSGCRGR